MSHETTIRQALTAHAPLVTLVGAKIKLGLAEKQDNPPYVAYGVNVEYERGLANNILATKCIATIEAWATTGAESSAIADEIEAALQADAITVVSRSTVPDEDAGLSGTIVLAEWWA